MDFTAILTKYGLDVGQIGFLVAAVIFSTELLKKHFNMKGNLAFLGAVISTAVWVAVYYLPLPPAVVAGVVVLVSATGGHQWLKTMAGKVGEDAAMKPLSNPSTR